MQYNSHADNILANNNFTVIDAFSCAYFRRTQNKKSLEAKTLKIFQVTRNGHKIAEYVSSWRYTPFFISGMLLTNANVWYTFKNNNNQITYKSVIKFQESLCAISFVS